ADVDSGLLNIMSRRPREQVYLPLFASGRYSRYISAPLNHSFRYILCSIISSEVQLKRNGGYGSVFLFFSLNNQIGDSNWNASSRVQNLWSFFHRRRTIPEFASPKREHSPPFIFKIEHLMVTGISSTTTPSN